MLVPERKSENGSSTESSSSGVNKAASSSNKTQGPSSTLTDANNAASGSKMARSISMPLSKDSPGLKTTRNQQPSAGLLGGSNQMQRSLSVLSSQSEGKWVPSPEWVQGWKSKLPLQTVMRLLQVLVPQVQKICIDKGMTDESEILKFLQHGTLVGLLPVPHPILIRKYQANNGTTMCLRTYMWGVIYLRSVQMKLYSMHKREFVIIFLGFFVALGLAVFIGLVGPPITWSTEIHASYLDNVTDMSTGPFVLKSPPLTTYNQQLWLISKLEIESKDDDSLDLYGIATGTVVKILNTSNKRSRHLKCQGECEPFTVLHLGFIDFAKYFIVVRFSVLKGVHERYHIKDVDFYFKTYNPNFTQMEMSFRFIYSAACFTITSWFMFTPRKFVLTDWSIEQKWMSILLPMLFLYNNPLFPLMFLVNSTLLGMMDAVFQVSFMSTLLIFWLSIYHGLRQVERRFLTFYLPKFVLVGSLWLSAMIFSTWQKLNTSKDSTFSYEVETEKFEKLKNFFAVCGICYVVYLTYLILKAYSEIRSMPYFDLRLKFLTGLMLTVVKLTIAITYMRFGMDILEDHFVADLSTKYSSSAEFMCFYGLLNFYVFTMVYVYSPSSSAVLNNSSQITKDNPQFSMKDDSDDEVISGSDEDEDTKTPLNSNSPSHSTNNHHHDDSD